MFNSTHKRRFVWGISIFLIAFVSASYFIYKKLGVSEADWESRHARGIKLEEEQKRLANEINSLVHPAVCHSHYDCKVMGLGAKTCDGYQGYMIYSVVEGKASVVEARIEEFNKNAEEMAALSLKAMPCGHPPGELKCDAGVCAPVLKNKE